MSQDLSVAHVNVARGYRGGERQTELLIRELAKHGVAQTLVARRGEPLAERVGDIDVTVRPTAGHPLGVFRATRGVDIVHVHEGRSVYAAWLRSVVSGTPYVLTRRVDNAIGEHWLAHRAYRGASCVAAITPAVEEVVTRFDPRIRTTVISSTSTGFVVDNEKVASIRGRYEDRYLVGHVGALDEPAKGQKTIIAAARMLADSDPDVMFLLVGSGPDESELRAAARGLPNLEFEGFVDNVGDYLAAFDTFILPSYREGLGSILLDAMDHRLPIIATRVGGIPTVVHDGKTGLLIEPRRPDQLAGAPAISTDRRRRR